MLTAQEEARILAKIRKDSYGITLEQMKQYFIEHQHAREIGCLLYTSPSPRDS